MKKFLSMLLVLCMVFTTLMGTMVVDVNAAFSKAENKITYVFDDTQTRGFDLGNWYMSNGVEDDEVQIATNIPYTTNEHINTYTLTVVKV